MYKHVLLPVDLNQEESWRKALPVAIENCKAFGAELHVLTVIPDLHMPMIASHFPENFMEKLILKMEAGITKFVEDQVPKEIKASHAVVSGGKIYEMIIDYANDHDVDLIVMEAYHPDLKDYLLGSNAEKVARHARQSVLVVRE
ncbi:MAG TPA: universal stress protein [Gammaproteobacteria bacterium]|nr:universal stress protein [Gammaproteobacteria bacterium]